MTRTARLTLGLTEGDEDANYYPTMHGYREGAAQDRYVLDVPADLLAGVPAHAIAEACFAGTNEPQMFADSSDPLIAWIARAVLPMREIAQGGTMRSLSVGDTVEFGDCRLECGRFGWVTAGESAALGR